MLQSHLEATLSETQSEIPDLLSKLSAAEHDKEELSTQLDKLTQRANELAEEVKLAASEREQLESQLDNLHAELDKQQHDANSDLHVALTQIARLEEKLAASVPVEEVDKKLEQLQHSVPCEVCR